MKRNGVLVLECLDHADPGSEGRFLSHMFDLMEVEHQYVEIRTRNQLISGGFNFELQHRYLTP